MHEFSLVQSFLRQIEDLMSAQGAERVSRLRVRIGVFSGVEPELFRLAYEELAGDSRARGAQLEIETIPLVARCADCNLDFPIIGFRFLCSRCGGREVRIVSGEELILDSVTMEVVR